MLMQTHRPPVASSSILARHRSIAGRISPAHGSMHRMRLHRGGAEAVAHESFSAPRAAVIREGVSRVERSCGSQPCSPSTLLPWADPYIADLHRRHEGEMRRERRELE